MFVNNATLTIFTKLANLDNNITLTNIAKLEQ